MKSASATAIPTVAEYRHAMYEKYIELLSRQLNAVHSENHDRRYWELIAGPWLIRFLYFSHSLYTLAGRSAEAEHPEVRGQNIPFDFASFIYLFDLTDYARQLQRQLRSSETGPARHGYQVVQLDERGLCAYRRPTFAKSIVQKLAAAAAPVMVRMGSILTVGPSIRASVAFRITLLSLFRVVCLYFPKTLVAAVEARPEMRQWMIPCGSPDDAFDEAVSKILLFHMPAAYVEHYREIKARARRFCSRRTKLVFSALSWYEDEVFKVLSATLAERGAKLVGHQHGGGYGTAQSKLPEYETRPLDVFLTWGWSDPAVPNARPFFSLKLSDTARKYRGQKSHDGRNILYLSSIASRHTPNGWPAPAGEQMPAFFGQRLRFLTMIDDEVRRQTIVRLHPTAIYGWSDEEQLRQSLPDIRIENEGKLVDALSRAKLVVADNNATTFLEAYACDIPVVLFFDLSLWPIREHVLPLFSQMESTGLFHRSAESAAKFVNEIVPDPRAWWDSPKVAGIRGEFKRRFAMTSDSFEVDFIKRLLSETRARA